MLKYVPAIISNEFKPIYSILIEVTRQFINLIFHKYFMGYRRKMHTASLCKSIMFSIQWFQIHHIITFSTIYNKVVGLSGAKVSPFHGLVPPTIMRLPSNQYPMIRLMRCIYLDSRHYCAVNMLVSYTFHVVMCSLDLLRHDAARVSVSLDTTHIDDLM